MFIADPKARSIAKMELAFLKLNRIPFHKAHPEEKCIGCYWEIEGHEDWEDAKCKKVKGFDNKGTAYEDKKDIDAKIASYLDRKADKAEKALKAGRDSDDTPKEDVNDAPLY